MTILPDIAKLIRRASLALPIDHPDQGPLQAAHSVLFSPSAATHPLSVDNSRERQAAQPLGREQG